MSTLKKHPHIRSGEQLTRGERAADTVRNGMGSWPFVFTALVLLGIWMAYNRNIGFDPYPFILLNLLLSCLAAMQGSILLIAAKRADTISGELALHTYQVDKENLELTRAVHQLTQDLQRLTTAVYHHVGADSTDQGRAPGNSAATT
ncbi:MAG: DUF1003 domain-containing protein [Ilumatobacteraceae bacterium]